MFLFVFLIVNPFTSNVISLFKIQWYCFFQVISVIKRHPGVQKISFIGHSLGGLVARYAIARLYERDVTEASHHASGECRVDESEEDSCQKDNLKGRIAGLEPVNFITCATPHLGSRGHKQVTFCTLNVHI